MDKTEEIGVKTPRIYREMSCSFWFEVACPIDCGVKLSFNWRDIFGQTKGVVLDVDEESARAFAESILTAIEDDSTSTEVTT